MTRTYGSFYKSVEGGEGNRCNYPTRLDTYGCGCAHDCRYCYAKSLLAFRGNWRPDDPAVAPLDAVRRKLDRIEPGTILRLGGMTDCFQPAERTHRVTLAAIKMMNERGIGYLVVTKSALVAEDEYVKAMDTSLAHIQISVTSTSDEPNVLDEKASPQSERMQAARRLQDAGFDVQLRLSPYLPELIDLDVLAASGVDRALVEFLRLNGFISKWLSEAGYDIGDYTHKSGGYKHLDLDRKLELLEPIRERFETSVCDDVQEHYEYWRDNVNPNPDDCCDLKRA